jgi:hypothetical protein
MNHTHTTTVLLMKRLSAKSTRSKNIDFVMIRVMKHNLRQIHAEIGSRECSRVDMARIGGNFILRGGDTPELVANETKSLMAGIAVTKWHNETIGAVEIVFGLPASCWLHGQSARLL